MPHLKISNQNRANSRMHSTVQSFIDFVFPNHEYRLGDDLCKHFHEKNITLLFSIDYCSTY